jgi:hypothetical protein
MNKLISSLNGVVKLASISQQATDSPLSLPETKHRTRRRSPALALAGTSLALQPTGEAPDPHPPADSLAETPSLRLQSRIVANPSYEPACRPASRTTGPGLASCLPFLSIHRTGALLLVHRASPSRSPAAYKVAAARCYAGVSAGSPYGREAMDTAVSAASEGRERRVHFLQELAPNTHRRRSVGAPRQHQGKFFPFARARINRLLPNFPTKPYPEVLSS